MENITQQIQQIEKDVNQYIKLSEEDFSIDKMNKIQPEIEKIVKQIDQISETNSQTLNKKDKGRLLYLKGKSLDLFPNYTKLAEESLSKSLKLNPVDVDCWNTLGHILWKKQDYDGAKKCFEGSLEQCGKNKQTLRYLSMILRQVNDPENRKKNVEKSIEYAKLAINMDLSDGESWYVLGNSMLIDFFVNLKKIDQLNMALKAYNQAEQYSKKPNPDLYYNRGQILSYLAEYEKAIIDYERADSLDQKLESKSQIKQIKDKIKNIYSLTSNKGKISSKRLANMTSSIPVAVKTQPKNQSKIQYSISPLNELKEGINLGKILTCKVTHVISSKNDVPATFVFVDFKLNFGCLHIYNASNEIYDQVKENADISIIDPMLKQIKLKDKQNNQEESYEYNCIQIFEIDKLIVDLSKVTHTFSPSVIVNETFQEYRHQEQEKKD